MRLRIVIAQRSVDKPLMNSLMYILKCSTVSEYKDVVTSTVPNFKDVYYKILPIFNKYDIKGIKALDFQYFCFVAELINKKAHLTVTGLEEISNVKLYE